MPNQHKETALRVFNVETLDSFVRSIRHRVSLQKLSVIGDDLRQQLSGIRLGRALGELNLLFFVKKVLEKLKLHSVLALIIFILAAGFRLRFYWDLV